MRRDMDFIRLILLDTEGETEVNLSPYSEKQINYHKKLLLDSGFVEGLASQTSDKVLIDSLTWAGHDFLDDARDDKIWKEALREIGKTTGSFSLDVLKAVLSAVATNMIIRGQP